MKSRGIERGPRKQSPVNGCSGSRLCENDGAESSIPGLGGLVLKKHASEQCRERLSRPHRCYKGCDSEDLHNSLQIVCKYMQTHLCTDSR
jgi:hypothetical protein